MSAGATAFRPLRRCSTNILHKASTVLGWRSGENSWIFGAECGISWDANIDVCLKTRDMI